MIKALFLDFDGLYFETEGPIYQSWTELYAAYGLDLPLEKWVTIIGTSEGFDPMDELVRLSGRPVDRQAEGPQRRQRELSLIDQQPVLPGVVDLLQAARQVGLKLAVVSSSSRRWVSGHLERVGLLGYFERLVTRDDVTLTKPDPELYLKALAAFNLAPHEAIVFEDSLNGILAAKAAGIYAVAIPNDLTRGLDFSPADLRVETCTDLHLPALLDHFNRF